MIDRKARKTLFQAYWSSEGWKIPREEPSAADLDHAKSCGVMFDFVTLTHDEVIERILSARASADVTALAQSFLASFSTREVHLRPGLASWFLTDTVATHPFEGNVTCGVCRQFPVTKEHDLSATNFARLKWGRTPEIYLLDHAFVLERAVIEQQEPTAEDRDLLAALLDAADSLPHDARARDLERALKSVIRSNRQERECVIEVLAASGVLSPSRVSDAEYARIPPKTDWSDTAALWRGDDGVKREQAAKLFGQG